jgi:hypothetical protein
MRAQTIITLQMRSFVANWMTEVSPLACMGWFACIWTHLWSPIVPSAAWQP